jgi:hypothetical protein
MEILGRVVASEWPRNVETQLKTDKQPGERIPISGSSFKICLP